MSNDEVDPHEATAAEPGVASPKPLAAGREIGGYALISILGEGGMGVVWRAHDPDLDREIAIKLLKRTDAAPSLRKRLLREARAMARLKHPNVLTVYEVGTEGERDFIAMELVEGSSLDAWLDTHPPQDEVLRALFAAGRGLAAAHRAGLVHRDFKPHNILRSRDGRVLVTDFGLARGLGDDAASGDEAPPAPVPSTPTPSSSPPAPSASDAGLDVTHDAGRTPTTTTPASRSSGGIRTDSLLDSTLTQTGALIGTPAYMAPEQFLGAPPDPRTDQFAFSVSAWQALTGARPYHGANIDELRAAVERGIAGVPAELPPAVRAVLARGLDPEPDRRWPDLDALLEELAHAIRPRRPRWIYPAAGLGVVAVAVGVSVLALRATRTTTAAANGPCEPADAAFAQAWSPALRAEIWKDLRARGVELDAEAFARVADPFDAFRTAWTRSYDQACADPKAKLFHARVGCLLGVRDQVRPMTQLVRTGTPEMFARFDAPGMLPNLAMCSGPSPVAPPLIPDDKRVRIDAVLASAMSLPRRDNLAQAIDRLEAEVADIGWQPLQAMILTIGGNAYLARGDAANARELFQRSLPEASEAHDVRMQAIARVGLLEASIRELADPASDAKPGELHDELTRELTYARSAVRASGNDPMLAASLALLEGRVQLELAQWGRYPQAYDEALAHMTRARQQYEAAQDLRRASIAAAMLAETHLRRGGPRDLDNAAFVTRAAAEALERAKLPPSPFLEHMRATIELARGDLHDAQQRFHQLAGARPPGDAPELAGVVTGPDGKPVASARVVVWRGELAGDASALFTDPAELDGEWADAGLDGSFRVRARPGDVIMAEFADARSTPRPLGAAPEALHLAPTRTVAGTILPRGVTGVFGYARFEIGTASWLARAPVRPDGTFRLDRLPAGTRTLGVIGPAGTGTRRVAAPATSGDVRVVWPLGEAIEVIVRGPHDPGATAWVLRGAVAPRTRAELEAQAARAGDVAWSSLGPIGADNTDAGRARYQRHDRHAVITGNPDGEVAVCLARAPGDDATVVCQQVTITQTVARDPEDGPRPMGVTPVVFDEKAP